MWFNGSARLVCRKELTQFFSSPIAYLFLGGFIAVLLYIFFWVDRFFARNIADVRPLFEWLPIILIFLAAAITMRMWSEERRSGTLEFVLTSPVSISSFVAGKFCACVVLLLIALLLTLPIPLSVAVLADLDWGPVLSAYLAAVLLGSAYLSIGLYISARSETQIVALILTTLACGLLLLLGSPLLTDLFSNNTAQYLRLLGSGSRFESIQRGVLDIRDLYYYVSLTAVFLVLNIYSLKKTGWAHHGKQQSHTRQRLATALLIINILLVNVWMHFINFRMDTTRGNYYSLSDTSKNYLQQLQEPLLIRGYFSEKTHPLLAPLVPRIKDLLKEFEIAGEGQVRLEIIDPIKHPELENEANKKYGITAVPLQITDKYQAALVNSYFNVLVQYGDQYEVLGFRDLIEIKAASETDIDVQLRNPEYDITRAIKKTLAAYQSAGNLFEQLPSPVTVSAYISSDERLPAILKTLKQDIAKLFKTVQSESNDKVIARFIEPETNDGQLTRMLLEQYGFKPMTASLLDNNTFYFYVVLESGNEVVQIPLPQDYKVESFERNFDAGLKRFAQGFLKTVGIVQPEVNPYLAQLGGDSNGFTALKKHLQENLNVKNVDLKSTVVPGDIDILLVLAPENLQDAEVFAIDQFIMQGGQVIFSTSPYTIDIKDNKLLARQASSGLEKWFAHNGIRIGDSFVLDPVNSAFPIPVTRNAGGFTFQEIRMLDYPFFIDIREGLPDDHAIAADLGQLTLPWMSPIEFEPEALQDKKVTELINSSAGSWLSKSTDVMPRITADGSPPFPAGEDQQPMLLAAIIEGKFNSFFKSRPAPVIKQEDADKPVEPTESYGGIISHSPANARIMLISSNELLQDQTTRLLTSAQGSTYLNAYQFIANAIDWSLEDEGLLKIRARGHFNQTLPPMEHSEQLFWEYGHYLFAVFVIALMVFIRRLIVQRKKSYYHQRLSDKGGA